MAKDFFTGSTLRAAGVATGLPPARSGLLPRIALADATGQVCAPTINTDHRAWCAVLDPAVCLHRRAGPRSTLHLRLTIDKAGRMDGRSSSSPLEHAGTPAEAVAAAKAKKMKR